MGLAKMCRNARARKGWTLREAEARTGISNALLSQIETGKQDNPTLRTIAALCDGYGLSPAKVIASATPPPTEGEA
jgi:transcriptional regulator with XRE-family HTH domain